MFLSFFPPRAKVPFSWYGALTYDSSATQHKLLLSCVRLWDPVDCSPPGCSVHGILQARMLEWVAMPSSRGSSQSKDWMQVSCTSGGFFTIWTTREAQLILYLPSNPKYIIPYVTKLNPYNKVLLKVFSKTTLMVIPLSLSQECY